MIEVLFTIGTPNMMPWPLLMPLPSGVVLSTSCVPFVMLEIVVFGAMFAPMTACPAASPAVLGKVTVVVVVAAAALRLTPRLS